MTFWDLLQDYVDEWGATEAAVLRRAHLNKGAFTAWRQRGIPALPEKKHLVGLADALHVPYEKLLDTILHDIGYLPESVARGQDPETDESLMISQGELRWGPTVHRYLGRVLSSFGFNLTAAYEWLESHSADGNPTVLAARDYAGEILAGKTSLVVLDETNGPLDEVERTGAPLPEPSEVSAVVVKFAPNERQRQTKSEAVDDNLDLHDPAIAARTTSSRGKVREARERQDEVEQGSQDRGGMDPA